MRNRVDKVFADARVAQAFRYISDHEAEIERDQILLTQIAAPPFGEQTRAQQFRDELTKLGLSPQTDEIGNVTAAYSETGPNPVVIGAHLDTIFPASTRLELQRKGRALLLPGISDNGAGLVAVLWTFRAARKAGMRFQRPVIIVGNVGEEGEGNLRGVRHLFSNPQWNGRECDFIAVDGAGFQRVTNQALGSRRFRIRMSGPGGHSWADFGRPNPVQAIAFAIHTFCSSITPRPGTSFNFGVVRGGISVNAIPSEANLEVDLRSIGASSLDDMERLLRRAAADATRTWSTECKIESMGERPCGMTHPESELVRAAVEVTRRFGVEPQLDIGSTDANLPISLGLPAIALGGGGTSGNVHTPEEWFDPTNRDRGIQRLLALISVLAGTGNLGD